MVRFLRLLLAAPLVSGLFVLAGPAEEGGGGKVPMNLIVDLNCDLANAVATETRVSPEPVDEVILGAKVDGHGIAYTVSGVEFIPDDRKALLEMVIRTRFDSQTTGSKGPVVAFNSNWTFFHGRKPVWLTCDGISWDPAYVAVRTNTKLDDIHVKPKGLIGAIIRPLAYRGYERDKEKAREEGDSKGGVKFVDNLDRESGKELAKQNKEFLDRLERLRKRNVLGKPLQFRTTSDQLIVAMRLVEENQPPTIAAPLPVQGVPAGSIRIHESLINTMASRLYSDGKEHTPASIEQDMKDLGLLDEETKPSESKDAVVFATQDPIRASFRDRLIKLTFRTTQFKREVKQKPIVVKRDWETTVTYQLSRTPNGLRMVRVGMIEAIQFEPGFSKRTGGGFNIVERNALIALFQRNLETEYDLDIKPTGDLKKIGTLEADQGKADNGWLLLAWKRNPHGQ